jgi:hypothetical protein
VDVGLDLRGIVKKQNRAVMNMLLPLATACAHVSAVAAPDPVALPGLKFSCRILSLSGLPLHGAVGFQFEDGALLVNDRLISAVYDSLGNPLLLVITGTDSTRGAPGTVRGISVSFPAGEPAVGFQVVEVTTTSVRSETKREPLSRPMLAESRKLAKWLWGHRCAEP